MSLLEQSSGIVARTGRGKHTSPSSFVPVVHPSVVALVAGSALLKALIIKVEHTHTQLETVDFCT